MGEQTFEIFLATSPGLEQALADEVHALGFAGVAPTPGGVVIHGGWHDVWRANLSVRGASRVLARITSFRVDHLAKLDKRARQVDWASVLRSDIPVRVDATCRKSRIYHSGAAAQRIATAISATIGAPISEDAALTVRARLDHDICTIAVDTSGEILHKRGHKAAVAKAPLRETLAALFLRQCGYQGGEPVVDLMCGSGTFIIEAAEMAAGLQPGRSRAFAFETLATFDADAWRQMRTAPRDPASQPLPVHHGSDRDAGAVRMSIANAERAGVATWTHFIEADIRDATPPDGPPGLVMINPPYGARIGEAGRLAPLYRSIGQTLMTRFRGWRVGLLTSEKALARATGLPFLPTDAPVVHGGLRITLFRTGTLD